jgi:3-dehydroquinate dehydratase/shikimate dehydrogenase
MALVCISIAVRGADEVSAALDRARAAVASGARLIEWRIDALGSDSTLQSAVGASKRLVADSPAPCIITCRAAAEGGEFAGDEASRISLLEAVGAGDPAPRYIDLELASFERSANLRQKVLLAVDHAGSPRDLTTGLILSAHDFRGRPPDLLQQVERMMREPACAAAKVAWMARSIRDNLEAFDLLAERRKPMIALCLGRFGLMSRVLAPKFGGLLTYASDDPAAPTAPGQPTVEELMQLYRIDRINARTRVYGVIGWPVEHSRGPVVHNAGFEAIGFNGVYLPLAVPPEWEHFKASVGALIDHPRLDFRGASVTIPHKEHLVRFVLERGGPQSRLDAISECIGAANTLIVHEDRSLECMNTDAPAAVQALMAGLRGGGPDPRPAHPALAGLRIAVLGAGGAARAVIAGLLEAGAAVVVFNRDRDRAAKLVEHLRGAFGRDARRELRPGTLAVGATGALGCGCFHVIFNCTPIGMTGGPDPDGSPLEALSDGRPVHLDDSVTVMDTVYTPEQTPLIREAASRGARVIPGTAMFLRQAAMQFERWTGSPLPVRA